MEKGIHGRQGGRLDLHDYHHSVGDLAKLREYSEIAQKLHVPVWMSELGCCFRDQKEKDGMWGALFMADSIRMDLRDLGAEVWVLWQPDWEVIGFDPQGGAPVLKKQYYAIAQYTRFIRPGFQVISAGGAYDTLPPRSITTYVIEGVSPRRSDVSDHIEGIHKVVSLGTHQCLNIAADSTISGAAVIPFSCGAFSNETFNFVDRGAGYYSIHTVNDQPGLCLNVSNATPAPGDGRTRGGPGNLIQWSCVGGQLPANELFEIAAAGSGSYWIRPHSSGLCLEDPGRGGTLRQNRCDPKAANQKFLLVD